MNILYLTYDGLTDQLGQSQIIPYLEGAAANGHSIYIVSCEKPERLSKDGATIKQMLSKSAIEWQPVEYSNETPVLSQLATLRRMRKAAKKIIDAKRIDLIHSRSTLPAITGLRLKKKTGIPLLYDMRGFWADERVEGGIWPQNKWLYRTIYQYIKKQEHILLKESDHIISLTYAAKEIMQHNSVTKPITVIPCCADYHHFDPAIISEEEKKNKKAELGIKENDCVIIYTGSIGTWYMLKEMMIFFDSFQRVKPESILLFVTRESHELIHSTAVEFNIESTKVKTVSSGRNDMPLYLSIANVSLYFILPVSSKKASSPVKQGESLAMGIPVITNSGIGDSDALIAGNHFGWVVQSFSRIEFERVSHEFLDTKTEKENIRSSSMPVLSLEQGIKEYLNVYASFQ